MTDMLRAGLSFLNAQRHAHMSSSVTYARGAFSVVLNATIGKTAFRQTDDYGVIRRYEMRDFIVQASDLVLNTETVLPEPGDKITQTENDIDYVYEVMSPGDEPHYRFSDAYMMVLRIHTKLVNEVT